MYKSIILDKADGIATITLNMPQTMNALCVEINTEILSALEEISGDESVRVLIITGGEKVFAAGANIRDMMDAKPFESLALCQLPHRLNDALEQLPIPVIAVINGMALGGGLELALACDFRVAAEDCVLGLPEAGLGIIPGAGGTQRLLRLVGLAKTQEIVMLGNKIKGKEAEAIGLVTKVTEVGGAMEEALKMAGRLKKVPAASLKFAKAAIHFGASHDITAGKEHEKALFALCFSGLDQREGMAAFAEKRPPVYTHGR
jgi:enoyl-CoA hydratase